MWCFVHFDFEMCFAPQRRALFRHHNFQKWSDAGVFEMRFAPQRRALFRHCNFQKWSEREVFLALSLTNALRATTACTFSSLIWPDGSAPAALASLLFDPSGATNHWKNSVSRLSYLFAHLLIVSLFPTSKVRTPRSKWKTDPVVTQCFPTLSKLRRFTLGKGCLCNKASEGVPMGGAGVQIVETRIF